VEQCALAVCSTPKTHTQMLQESMCVGVPGGVLVCDVDAGRECVCQEYQKCSRRV